MSQVSPFRDVAARETGDIHAPAIELTETYFGAILREVEPLSPRRLVMRAILRGIAGLCIVGAPAIWLWPLAATLTDLIAMQWAISLTLLALGFIFAFAARDLPRPEIHIDTKRREIRFAERCGAGKAHLSASFAMDHVTGVTVDPVVPGSEHAALSLILDGVHDAMHLVSGMRPDLLPLAARLRRDLRRPSQRIEDRLRVLSRAA